MLKASQFNYRHLARLVRRVSVAAFVAAAATSVHAADIPAAPAGAVDGFLKAGEFGAAAQAAGQVQGAQQEALLQQVAAVQVKMGDAVGAQLTLAQLASAQSRGPLQAEMAREQSLSGASGADFTQVIQLIQDHTEGPWQAIDGVGGTIGEFEAGIRVDPQGVLVRTSREEESGRLANLGLSARQAALNEDMSQSSKLRMVSLTRLEREVAARIAEGKSVVESMQQLAGLSQIQYIFIYPEAKEIVIAGPAEGWRYDAQGRTVGTQSGRPTLHLDDLVTVLRTFDAGGQNIFGCSIDPRSENLKSLREFAAASQSAGPLSPGSVRGWANELGQILGRQDITIYGIPLDSRAARVLVEADYRMKLIGVGKLEGGSDVPDYFELLAKNPGLASGSLDALRWWLTMNYDEVLHTADRDAFEVRGSSVRCQSENQFLTAEGQRVGSGKSEPVNQQFAANFTQHYAELAQHDPIFADLQGI